MKRAQFICLVIFFSSGFNSVKATDLTPQQLAGKLIYTTGIGSTDQKVTANMSGVQIPATIMPCINCHNASGTGNPEGGITPSNITWKQLTRSYGGKRISGESYPAYTVQTLGKVITTGIDPGGNKLHNAMPTYNMTRTDLDNLISYIKVLGQESDIGLTDSTIHIGFGLKGAPNVLNEKNEALKKLVNAYCKNINKGNIYNRKLKVSFFYSDENFDENEYFLITGAKSKNDANRTSTTPALFLCSEQLTQNGLKNNNTFYIYPSITAQSNALVDFSIEQNLLKPNTPLTIVYSENTQRTAIAHNVNMYCTSVSGIKPKMITINVNNIQEIASSDDISSSGLLIFIGNSQIGNKLIAQLDTLNKSPFILCPGSISGIDLFNLPYSIQDKVFISYPTWITERSMDGLYFYKKLATENNLSQNWKNSQLDALSMFLTLEECLKRIGRDLSREEFVSTMENMHEFRTGLTPTLSYNKNQRVGTSFVYIAGFDNVLKQLKLVKTINGNG